MKFVVEFEEEEINYILECMGHKPYREVAHRIRKIQESCSDQILKATLDNLPPLDGVPRGEESAGN